MILFLSPGLKNRISKNVILSGASTVQRLYFGWTRFVYTNFILNQRIYLILSIITIIYLFINYKKDKDKSFLFLIFSWFIILITTIIFIFNLNILPKNMVNVIADQWAYFYYDYKTYLKMNLPVYYFLIITFYTGLFFIKKKQNYFLFIFYSLSFVSNFCFIITEMATERTSYLSYIFLLFNCIYLINEVYKINKYKLFTVICLYVFFSLLMFNYIKAYSKQYVIYLKNKSNFEKCFVEKCEKVRYQEYDWKYIFKSDLDLTYKKQDNWIFEVLRKYYSLKESVLIIK